MRRTLLLVAAATALLLGSFAPAQAITDGSLDNGAHPMVGLMSAQDENGTPLWRCTGTMISPTVFLTAGHCTNFDEDGVDVPNAEIWFGDHYDTNPDYIAAVEAEDETPCTTDAGTRLPGYPCTGDVSGTPRTSPDYTNAAFYLNDLGVVVLDEPYTPTSGTFGSLPAAGQFDSWRSKDKRTFTSVGYGLQRALGNGAAAKEQADKTRMVANPELISINSHYVGDYAMALTNNAKTGGTCFGDSGGPNFIGSSLTLAGVTSYGKNPTCGGQGGVYRLDRAKDLAWLATFL